MVFSKCDRKSHFYSCIYASVLWPLSSTHKPKINYISTKSMKEIMGKFLENPRGFSMNFRSRFTKANNSSIILPFCLCLITEENLRHCHKSSHTTPALKPLMCIFEKIIGQSLLHGE